MTEIYFYFGQGIFWVLLSASTWISAAIVQTKNSP